MSKKIEIDFSVFDENEVGEKYWSPPEEDYYGSHSYSETRYGIANYLNIGDVGDPDWREGRRLPFGDEALEALYPGSRGLSFIQYPGEHPDADDVNENPVSRMIENDLALEWALKEMNDLQQGSDKYNQLADLIAEIRGYNASQVEEEAFIHAPSWAMDSLIYAQERSNDPEITKIVEDFAPRKSMQGKVISTAMYPDARAIKSIAGVYDEYNIKLPEGSREYCFALKNGKKTFGPYGGKYSNIKIFRDPNARTFENAAFRKEQMFKVLNDIGIIPVFDEENKLHHINHMSVTPDNLLEAKANYSALAGVINEAHSTISFFVQHINLLQEDLYWDKLKSYLKKINAYNDVLSWSAKLNKERATAPCLRAIGHVGLCELIEDYDSVKSMIYGRINTTYYVLIAGKNNQVTITESKDEADYFKSGNADDLLYFLLDKKSKNKLGPLETVTNVYGFQSKERDTWISKALVALSTDRSRYSQESVQQLIAHYNTNRRVKTITSRTMREYGWLLAELPLTRKEVKTLSDCLEAYGRAIVAAQQQVPVIRQVFGRFKSVVERDLANSRIPEYAIQSIKDKSTVSFVYKLRTKDVPSGEERKDLLSAGLISQEEIRTNKYLDIELHYDYIFSNPSDVFRYVNNFAVTPATIKLAMSK